MIRGHETGGRADGRTTGKRQRRRWARQRGRGRGTGRAIAMAARGLGDARARNNGLTDPRIHSSPARPAPQPSTVAPKLSPPSWRSVRPRPAFLQQFCGPSPLALPLACVSVSPLLPSDPQHGRPPPAARPPIRPPASQPASQPLLLSCSPPRITLTLSLPALSPRRSFSAGRPPAHSLLLARPPGRSASASSASSLLLLLRVGLRHQLCPLAGASPTAMMLPLPVPDLSAPPLAQSISGPLFIPPPRSGRAAESESESESESSILLLVRPPLFVA